MKKLNWNTHTVEEVARKAAGNGLSDEDISAYAKTLDNPKDWYFWCLESRDSDLLAKSNADTIRTRMAEYTDKTAVFFQIGHYALGYVNGLAVRVFDGPGKVTDAFVEVFDIHAELSNYPVLYEDDLYRREYEVLVDNTKKQIETAVWLAHFDLEITDKIITDVIDWLREHAVDQTENIDGYGAAPGSVTVLEALLALGHIPPECEDCEGTGICGLCQGLGFILREGYCACSYPYNCLACKGVGRIAVSAPEEEDERQTKLAL